MYPWVTLMSQGGATTLELLATSKSGTAIISPGPPRLGPDPKWDRRNALKVSFRPMPGGC